MESNLGKLEKMWSSRLHEFDYLGELELDESEYKYYSALFSKGCDLFPRAGVRLSVNYKTVFATLAVNCAYFEYDHEGFWGHFLSLIGLQGQGSPEIQDALGHILEDFLYEKKFLKERRQGSFRYVGAVLEQCGISRRHLKRFAEFLKLGVRLHGWAGLSIVSENAYQMLLPEEGMSGYLRKFLAERSGLEFVRNVARSIEQSRFSNDRLQYLTTLKGFRHSFWRELLGFLDEIDLIPLRTTVVGTPEPKLIYQPRLNRLVLMLDEENVRKRNYQFEDEIVSRAFIELLSTFDFKESYSFKVRSTSNTWRPINIVGWSIEKRPFAFFDADSGEILPNLKSIGVGEYGFVVKQEYLSNLDDRAKENFEKSILADYFWLSPPALGLKGFLLSLDDVNDLNFLINVNNQKSGKYISWKDKKNLLNGAENLFDVFIQKLPEVILKDPELFRSGHLMLMMKIGSEPKKIDIPETGNLLKIQVPIPSKGEIWVEPVGRQREFDSGVTHKLSFCCIPECRICWPEQLFSPTDDVTVEFKGHPSFSFSIEGGTFLDEQIKRWQLPPGKTFVEGQLIIDGLRLQLAKLIYRASLTNRFLQPIGTISLEDFFSNDHLNVTGYPKSKATIYLRLSGKDSRLADLGYFDDYGRIESRSEAVRDTLGRWDYEIGQIGIGFLDSVVLTESKIINVQKLIKLLENEENLAFSDEWRSVFDGAISLFNKAINNNLGQFGSIVWEKLPESLCSWGKEILACACVFDGVRLDQDLKNEKDQIYLDALTCYCQANSLIHAETNYPADFIKNLLNSFSAISWRPRIKRWLEKFESVFCILQSGFELPDLLIEWSKEVRDEEFLPEYKSRIGKMVGGRELTNAWVNYRKCRDKQAFSKASNVINNSSSPVKHLAYILINILRLKTAMTQHVDIEVNNCSFQLWPILDHTILRCKRANSEAYQLTSNIKDGVKLLMPLPLIDDDRVSIFYN
jgi:hypothetical protein